MYECVFACLLVHDVLACVFAHLQEWLFVCLCVCVCLGVGLQDPAFV